MVQKVVVDGVFVMLILCMCLSPAAVAQNNANLPTVLVHGPAWVVDRKIHFPSSYPVAYKADQNPFVMSNGQQQDVNVQFNQHIPEGERVVVYKRIFRPARLIYSGYPVAKEPSYTTYP